MKTKRAVREGEASEIRCFGPPGTGKTTWCSNMVERAVKKHGSDSVIVASFTNSASEELVGRGLPISDEQIGTLHSHCYRNLNYPEVVYNHIGDFNKFAPQYRLSRGMNQDLDDPKDIRGAGQTAGDELFQKYQTLRAKMSDRSYWPASVRSFADKWEEWKERERLIDFTDMIEINLAEELPPPGDPHIGFFDEAQDFTPLELELIRYWSNYMSHIVLVGDDDQCLYGFKGATPEAFLNPPLPDEQIMVLNQSYRVPRKIQQKAESWIKQVEQRQEKAYKPKDADGEVRRLSGGNYKDPECIVNDLRRYLEEGKEAMILGSCGYMLKPTLEILRELGIPFHNPYNRKRNDWNPLSYSGRGVPSGEKLLSYFRLSREVFGPNARLWCLQDLLNWVPLIKSKGNLRRGAKKELRRMYDEFEEDEDLSLYESLDVSLLLDIFEEDALDRAMDMDFGWFCENLLDSKRTSGMEFPINIIKNQGPKMLRQKPNVKVGTVHSVKGGESDVVYLFPDLSLSGMQEWCSDENRDRVIRLFYVGMTRAKDTLVICDSAGSYKVNI